MEGTDTSHENAEGMASVGVRLTDQLGLGRMMICILSLYIFNAVEPMDTMVRMHLCERLAGRLD